MGARTDTRRRMIDAAKIGFRTNGVGATSFSDVLERAGAARGAIYHHFPGGRRELVVAVIASTADNVSGALERSASTTPRAAFRTAIAALSAMVESEDGQFGCPVTPAVLDAAGDRTILDAGHTAFDQWQRVLVDDYGVTRGAATLTVAAVEGALVMCRAAKSSEPLDRIADELAALFPARRTRSGSR